jgi:RND superfamily putative drug exporter
MGTLARWSVRHRRWVLLGWLLLLALLIGLRGAVGTTFRDNSQLPDTESTRALQLLQREFPDAAGDQAQIVVHARDSQVTDPAVRARIAPMLARVADLPRVDAVVSFYDPLGASQVSPDRSIGFATVVFSGRGSHLPDAAVRRVVDTARAAGSPQVQVEVAGEVVSELNTPGTSTSEIIGVIGAAIVLFAAFGSLLAMTLPLITAIVALLAGTAAIGLLTHVFAIASFGPTLATLIGLGVGIDYALFIVTRHRSNLRHGMDVESSIVLSVQTAGRAVLFAGTIVCIALLGMFALGVSILYGLAVSASIVVAFTMATSLTLLPAVLGFFGMRVLSRRARGQLADEGPLHGEELSPRWYRWGEFVEGRPRRLAVAAGLFLVVLAVPFFSLRIGATDQGNDPAGTTTRRAYDLLARGFGPGFNGPFQIAAQIRSGHSAQDLATLERVRAAVKSTPDVVAVTPIERSPSGRAAIVQVYPGTSPQDAATTSLLHRLRNTVIPRATAGTGLIVHVGGETAISADFSAVLADKLPLFVGIVVLVAFLLLAAVFRSVVVPLMASVMNLLATGAAFGIVVAVFQWGWLGSVIGIGKTGPIEAFVPVMMFAILFGLSMDYEVFLVSRIHEDWLHRKDNALAVTLGQAETGKVITAAATIMVLVFASFVFGGERLVKVFGVGLASAVLLDALVVRTVLVPALMHIAGPANWWLPRWLDRLLPRLNIEGPDAAPQASTAGSAPTMVTSGPERRN